MTVLSSREDPRQKMYGGRFDIRPVFVSRVSKGKFAKVSGPMGKLTEDEFAEWNDGVVDREVEG